MHELQSRPEADEIELMRQVVIRDLDQFTTRFGPTFSPPPSPSLPFPSPHQSRSHLNASSSSIYHSPSPATPPPHPQRATVNMTPPPPSPSPFSPPFVPQHSHSHSHSHSHQQAYVSPPPNVTPTPHPLYYNQADDGMDDQESELDFSDDEEYDRSDPNRASVSRSMWRRKPPAMGTLQAIPEEDEGIFKIRIIEQRKEITF